MEVSEGKKIQPVRGFANGGRRASGQPCFPLTAGGSVEPHETSFFSTLMQALSLRAHFLGWHVGSNRG